MNIKRRCILPTCYKLYKPIAYNQMYCSVECRETVSITPSVTWTGLSTATLGALSELRVAADLLRRGFYVFRAVSPTGPCDLIFIYDKPFTVEVRTGRTRPGNAQIDCGRRISEGVDVFAVCINESTVHYFAISEAAKDLPFLSGLQIPKLVPRSA